MEVYTVYIPRSTPKACWNEIKFKAESQMIILKCDIFPYQLNNKLLHANKEGVFNRCISFEEEKLLKFKQGALS